MPQIGNHPENLSSYRKKSPKLTVRSSSKNILEEKPWVGVVLQSAMKSQAYKTKKSLQPKLSPKVL